MKSYDEMANNVFRRMEEYEDCKRKRNKRIVRSSASLLSLCLIAFAGIGVWQQTSGQKKVSHKEIVEDTTEIYEDSDREGIFVETCWAYDVTDQAAVREAADYLLKVRVKEKGEAKYFTENQTMPSTPYRLEVVEVLWNGDGSIPEKINLVIGGGEVSAQEYIDTLDEETLVKMGANTLADTQQKEPVCIYDDSYYELKQNQEYCIYVRDLTKDENYKGYYGIPAGGYGVFEKRDEAYVNVLTNVKLDISAN